MDDVAGRYEVLDLLGTGGMGEVVLAYDRILDRRVAIKRPRAGRDHMARHLDREARIAARMRHAGVVAVFDRITDTERCHLVMEHVDGPNLAELAGGRPQPLTWVLDLASDLAAALVHVHRHGVVHLDLKLENVLIGLDRRPKLIDFGISWCAEEPGHAQALAACELAGTPRAMAPEQIRGGAVDERTDLFAFGVLLHELVTGHSPFEAPSASETLCRVLDLSQPSVATAVPGIPRRLSDLIDHLLEKDPELRPQSAAEAATRLVA